MGRFFARSKAGADLNSRVITKGTILNKMNSINEREVDSALCGTAEYLAKAEALFSGKLFLAICIAHTCGTLYAMFLMPYSILSAVISVGLWLVFGYAKKGLLRQNTFVFKFLSVPMMIMQILLTVLIVTLIVCVVLGAAVCIFSTHEVVIDAILELLSSIKGMPEWIPAAIESFTWSGVWALVYLIVFSLIVYLPLQIACTFFAKGRKLFSALIPVFKQENEENDKEVSRCKKRLKRFTGNLVALGIVCCFINLPMAVALFVAHAFAEEMQSI